MQELPVIQKTYDLIRWYIPILNRLPKMHRFGLGERMVTALYDLLEGLIQARYTQKNKVVRLVNLNSQWRCCISGSGQQSPLVEVELSSDWNTDRLTELNHSVQHRALTQ